jgi:hypoxanthine phosphoribosyltransferase
MAGILRGAVFFLVDLTRALSIPVAVDFIAISSYGPGSRASGAVRILKDLEEEIAGRDVLVVEDIVDTGLTLGYLLQVLRARKPASLKICALLDRSARRIVDHPVAYRGFDVPDRFVVGYGLDYHQRHRNLPFIALLKPSA